MNLELADKRVFVAGASRGIGAVIAATFLAEGASVHLVARDGAALEARCADLTASGGQTVSATTGDMTDTDDIERALDAAGTIDILISNAGATDTAPGYDTSDAEWQRLIDANVSGPARLARAAVKRISGGGAIAFVGSIAGREVLGAPIAYTVGKCGLRALTKAMAPEVARVGIRVNMVLSLIHI